MKESEIGNLVGTLGLAVAIVIVLLCLLLFFAPKLWKQHIKQQGIEQKNKEKDRAQMDRLLNMYAEQTKVTTATLEKSNIVIEANTRVIENSSKIIPEYQESLIKYSEAIGKFSETINDLSDKVEKNNDTNQHVLTEILCLKNKIS
jgi:molybdopterin converting factor small subunit